MDGSGNWKHTNVWADGTLLATYDSKGLHFAFTDILGTKRVQASGTGEVEETCMSLPFGDGLNCTQTSVSTADDATEHHYTKKERDTESGLDYFGARYYTSTLGRFMSPDWASSTVPVPYADLNNPQSLNLYAYVQNNPVTHEDLTGHGGNICGGGDATTPSYSCDDGHGTSGSSSATATPAQAYDSYLISQMAQATASIEQMLALEQAQTVNNKAAQQQMNFSALAANYPGHDAYPTDPNASNSIWSLIGGHVAMNAWTTDADGNQVPNNTCAIRMSYDLNQSGLTIPKGKGTVSGADGKQYFLRVADLQKFLTGALGAPQKLAGGSFAGPSGSTGIISFNIPFKDATGHFTLWNGSGVADPHEPYQNWPKPTSTLFWGIQ
jgi:RHS repeat-associated protein